jgi:hypothetical protein
MPAVKTVVTISAINKVGSWTKVDEEFKMARSANRSAGKNYTIQTTKSMNTCS